MTDRKRPGRKARERLAREIRDRAGPLMERLPGKQRGEGPAGLTTAGQPDQAVGDEAGQDVPQGRDSTELAMAMNPENTAEAHAPPADLPEVAEIDEEPRRASSRIRVPHSFCFVDENGRPISLELTLIINEPVPALADCYLFDINEGGVGFITTEILTKGEHITICVTRNDDPDPLVAVEVEVLNQREYHGDKSHLPARYSAQPSWIYGVRMDEDSLGTLMCATLESLELEGEEMETDKVKSPNPALLRSRKTGGGKT